MKNNNIKIFFIFLSLNLLFFNNSMASTNSQLNLIITNKNSKSNEHNRILTFDWNKFYIGSAEYPEGPTGCTLFYFPDRNVNAVVNIRGGAAGSILTNDLEHGGSTRLDAIILVGGSTLGLEAATSVTSEIFQSRNYSYGWGELPFVAGSVMFDWVNRKKPLYPDKILGEAAFKSAEPGKFLLGKRGAGINARIAKVFGKDYSSAGGQGGAVKTFGEIKIAVFTVVNSLGAIYDKKGQMIHGYVDIKTGTPISEETLLSKFYPLNKQKRKIDKNGNTTLTVVIINTDLNLYEMQLMARQMHNSFNEVIRPFGTSEDGDTLYLVSTRELKIPEKERCNAVPHLAILTTRVIREAIYSAFEK